MVNQGISGARVLRDRMGDNALARFDRDVLSQPHADTVVLMMGINDIGWPGTLLVPQGRARALGRRHHRRLRAADRPRARPGPADHRRHADAVRGHVPRQRRSTATTARTRRRSAQAVNKWIRTSGAFDGVIDFDAADRDPANPKHIRAEFDSGDHLHPQDAGYKAMAEFDRSGAARGEAVKAAAWVLGSFVPAGSSFGQERCSRRKGR